MGLIERGWVAARGGRIVGVAAGQPRVRLARDGVERRARGRVVMPGFVDPHTHLLYAGERWDEFAERRRGTSYVEILERGGGIHATVAATRAASDARLLAFLRTRLRETARQGTTTIEVKSGYGLIAEEELRHIGLIARARREAAIEVVPTFLAAHALPAGWERVAYVREMAALVPRIARGRLAERVDVFVERGAFTLADARVLARAAAESRLGLTVHADQFGDGGGAALAARLGAVSADHLAKASERGLRAMARAGTVAVVLPGSALFVGYEAPQAARLRAAGVRIALGTDRNPGTSPLEGMPAAIALGVNLCGLEPYEALRAATREAAAALGRERVAGSLAIGRRADLLLLDTDDERDLAYRLGARLVRETYARGQRIAS